MILIHLLAYLLIYAIISSFAIITFFFILYYASVILIFSIFIISIAFEPIIIVFAVIIISIASFSSSTLFSSSVNVIASLMIGPASLLICHQISTLSYEIYSFIMINYHLSISLFMLSIHPVSLIFIISSSSHLIFILFVNYSLTLFHYCSY
jgi:hypothetical protein